MNVLLIGPDLEENLSLGYLASSLIQAGHQADLISFNGPADTSQVVNRLPEADIVGISLTYQAKAAEYLRLSRTIRQHAPGIRIIAGGHYATCAAQEILMNHEEIDIIVLHEGEETLVELAGCTGSGETELAAIQGIVYRQQGEVLFTEPRPKIEDLDLLPHPRRSSRAYILAGVPTAYILGSRGCLNSCYYCCISTLHRFAPGKRFRQRRPEAVVAEMAELYYQRGVRHFVFHDDNFLVLRAADNLQRLAEFGSGIKEHQLEGIGLTIKCCPTEVTEDVFSQLKQLGLVRVFLGIESSADDVVSQFNRKQTMRDVEEALEICRRLGIAVQFNIMVFSPYADFDTVRSDVAFMKSHSSYPLNFCRTELFAGTPLEKEMLEQNRVRGNYLARVYSMSSPAMDRAAGFFTRLFFKRCWSKSSLMLMTVSMEHLAAMLKHHYQPEEVQFLCSRIYKFVEEVNSDSLALLEEAVFHFEQPADYTHLRFLKRLNSLVRREKRSLEAFLRQGQEIEKSLTRFVSGKLGFEEGADGTLRLKAGPSNLARHAMAAMLALSITGMSGCIFFSFWGIGVSEYAPPPLEDTDCDGLYDVYERDIFNTDPELMDTDDDGVLDGDEDHDEDGITNREYQDKNLPSNGY